MAHILTAAEVTFTFSLTFDLGFW